MFTRFEEQWHCCGGGARLGGAMCRLSYDLLRLRISFLEEE